MKKSNFNEKQIAKIVSEALEVAQIRATPVEYLERVHAQLWNAIDTIEAIHAALLPGITYDEAPPEIIDFRKEAFSRNQEAITIINNYNKRWKR